jgi:hypothetical protein
MLTKNYRSFDAISLGTGSSQRSNSSTGTQTTSPSGGPGCSAAALSWATAQTDPADEAAGRRALETAHAREHKLFTGKLDKSKLGLLEKAAVLATHASEGDHRDWDEIDRWATEIAAQVRP